MAKNYQVELLIIETGIIYALADRKDNWHAVAARFMSDFSGRLFVPSSVIPERAICSILTSGWKQK